MEARYRRRVLGRLQERIEYAEMSSEALVSPSMVEKENSAPSGSAAASASPRRDMYRMTLGGSQRTSSLRQFPFEQQNNTPRARGGTPRTPLAESPSNRFQNEATESASYKEAVDIIFKGTLDAEFIPPNSGFNDPTANMEEPPSLARNPAPFKAKGSSLAQASPDRNTMRQPSPVEKRKPTPNNLQIQSPEQLGQQQQQQQQQQHEHLPFDERQNRREAERDRILRLMNGLDALLVDTPRNKSKTCTSSPTSGKPFDESAQPATPVQSKGQMRKEEERAKIQSLMKGLDQLLADTPPAEVNPSKKHTPDRNNNNKACQESPSPGLPRIHAQANEIPSIPSKATSSSPKLLNTTISSLTDDTGALHDGDGKQSVSSFTTAKFENTLQTPQRTRSSENVPGMQSQVSLIIQRSGSSTTAPKEKHDIQQIDSMEQRPLLNRSIPVLHPSPKDSPKIWISSSGGAAEITRQATSFDHLPPTPSQGALSGSTTGNDSEVEHLTRQHVAYARQQTPPSPSQLYHQSTGEGIITMSTSAGSTSAKIVGSETNDTTVMSGISSRSSYGSLPSRGSAQAQCWEYDQESRQASSEGEEFTLSMISNNSKSSEEADDSTLGSILGSEARKDPRVGSPFLERNPSDETPLLEKRVGQSSPKQAREGTKGYETSIDQGSNYLQALKVFNAPSRRSGTPPINRKPSITSQANAKSQNVPVSKQASSEQTDSPKKESSEPFKLMTIQDRIKAFNLASTPSRCSQGTAKAGTNTLHFASEVKKEEEEERHGHQPRTCSPETPDRDAAEENNSSNQGEVLVSAHLQAITSPTSPEQGKAHDPVETQIPSQASIPYQSHDTRRQGLNTSTSNFQNQEAISRPSNGESHASISTTPSQNQDMSSPGTWNQMLAQSTGPSNNGCHAPVGMTSSKNQGMASLGTQLPAHPMHPSNDASHLLKNVPSYQNNIRAASPHLLMPDPQLHRETGAANIPQGIVTPQDCHKVHTLHPSAVDHHPHLQSIGHGQLMPSQSQATIQSGILQQYHQQHERAMHCQSPFNNVPHPRPMSNQHYPSPHPVGYPQQHHGMVGTEHMKEGQIPYFYPRANHAENHPTGQLHTPAEGYPSGLPVLQPVLPPPRHCLPRHGTAPQSSKATTVYPMSTLSQSESHGSLRPSQRGLATSNSHYGQTCQRGSLEVKTIRTAPSPNPHVRARKVLARSIESQEAQFHHGTNEIVDKSLASTPVAKTKHSRYHRGGKFHDDPSTSNLGEPNPSQSGDTQDQGSSLDRQPRDAPIESEKTKESSKPTPRGKRSDRQAWAEKETPLSRVRNERPQRPGGSSSTMGMGTDDEVTAFTAASEHISANRTYSSCASSYEDDDDEEEEEEEEGTTSFTQNFMGMFEGVKFPSFTNCVTSTKGVVESMALGAERACIKPPNISERSTKGKRKGRKRTSSGGKGRRHKSTPPLNTGDSRSVTSSLISMTKIHSADDESLISVKKREPDGRHVN